jgi:FeS assembly SUF system protein
MDEIEHLKIHKIDPTTGRLRLSVSGQHDMLENVDEATAESGRPVVGLVDKPALELKIIDALKGIYDPEIPVNVYDLGLIYGVSIDDDAAVTVTMTLTAPACPVAGMIVKQVADTVSLVEGVLRARAQITWDPPWSKDRMSDEAKLELGLL